MWHRARIGFLGLWLVACSGTWSVASAQFVFESAGERALGMAGAFAAVADDATAVHWNPAGLASGQPAGMTIGWHRFQIGNPDAGLGSPGRRGDATLTSLGTWPLGLSYGATRRHRLVDLGDGRWGGESLRVRTVGVSVLQSVTDGLVVGSTLKVMRGSFAAGPVDGPTVGDALDRTADLDADGRTAFDLDLGVMASSPTIRVGLSVKNVTSPSFRAMEGNAVELPTQSRFGVAVLPSAGVTLAMDLDLNTVDLMGDLRRILATGGEFALGGRVQVRAGARWNLADDRQVAGAVGASLGIRRGVWLDGHYGLGRSDESREFGVALRAGF